MRTWFVAVVQSALVPLIIATSIVSGYNTYYGMLRFMSSTPRVALVITIAVQVSIVILAYELGTTYWRANVYRFLRHSIFLVVTCAVSINFAYYRFYDSLYGAAEYQRAEGELARGVNEFIAAIRDAHSKRVAHAKERANTAAQEYDAAYRGTLEGIPEKYRSAGDGPYAKSYKRTLDDAKSRLETTRKEMESLEPGIKNITMLLTKGLRGEGGAQRYEELRLVLADVARTANKVLAGEGVAPIASPTLPGEVTQTTKPTFVKLEELHAFPLFVAIFVDVLTVFFSVKLEMATPGPLSPHEEEVACDALKQFSDYRINAADQLEFSLAKTIVEATKGYNDRFRLLGAAILISRGMLRKRGPQVAEFAPSLYGLVVRQAYFRMGKTPTAHGAAEQSSKAGEEEDGTTRPAYTA